MADPNTRIAWIEWAKLLLGTTLVGMAGIILTYQIDRSRLSQEEFKLRGEYYERQLDRAIEADEGTRLFLADFLARFAPTEADRGRWQTYHGDLLKTRADLEKTTAEIELAAGELSEITRKTAEELSQDDRAEAERLAQAIAGKQRQQRIATAELRGLGGPSADTGPSAHQFRAGLLSQPRGIRNNNPVLVARDSWLGLMPRDQMTPAQLSEGEFAVFRTPAFGFRAGARIVQRQQSEAGKPISTKDQLFIWFGDHEARQTAAQRIARALGVAPEAPVDYSNADKLETFLTELAKFHNGVADLPYPPQVVAEGIRNSMRP